MTSWVCDHLSDDFNEHVLHHLHRMEFLMTESNANQQHLDADVAALGTAVATIISELKAQAAAGQPLDFTAADALVASTQGEATADAPPAPAPVDPNPAPVSRPECARCAGR